MTSIELKKFKDVIEDIKTDLHQLREQSLALCNRIEADFMVPADMIELLSTTLQVYKKKADLLHRTGKEISISISMESSFGEIEASLNEYEAQQTMASERELVVEYFRLSAESEDVSNSLEASKKLLLDKCRLSGSELTESLIPFGIVVRNVKQNSEKLPDADYDIVEDQIGKAIARAVDRGNLLIDPNQGISSYFDGSCILLQPIQNASLGGTQLITDNPEEAKIVEVSPYFGEEEDKKLPTTEHEPNAVSLPENDEVNVGENTTDTKADIVADEPIERKKYWVKFDGYVDDVKVEIHDTPALDLGASKFISTAKQKPGVSMAIFALGHEKLVAVEDVENEETDYYVPGEEITNLLKKQGYISEIVISLGELSKTFYTLTSKGWACFTKSDVVKFLRNEPRHLVVPKHICMSVSDWTPINALRTMLIRNYFSKQLPPKNYILFPESSTTQFVLGTAIGGDEMVASVCAAVFEAGNEKKDLETIRQLVNSKEQLQQLIIIVYTKEDIIRVSNALNLDDEIIKRISYCTVSNPTEFFNAQAETKENTTKPTTGAKETSTVTTTSIDEPELEKKLEEKPVKNSQQKVSDKQSDENPNYTAQQERAKSEIYSKPVLDLDQDKSFEAKLKKYEEEAKRLLNEKRIPDSLALFRALSRYNDTAKTEYRRVAYALDDPAVEKSYKYTDLQQVFLNPFGEEAPYDALGLAAYLRMFFSADILEEPYYVQNCMKLLDRNCIYNLAPQLKELLFALSECFNETGRGFDSYVLNSLLNSKGQQEQIAQYQTRAGILLNSKLEDTNVGNLRVKETRHDMFGPNSSFYQILSFVSRQDSTKISSIKDALQKYLNCNYEIGIIYTEDSLSISAMEEYADSVWNSLSQKYNHQRHDALKGAARGNILNKMKDIISTCITWVSLSESAMNHHSVINNPERLKTSQEKISKLISESIRSLKESTSSDNVEVASLVYTLDELLRRLTEGCDINRDKYFYVGFLKGNYLEIDDNCLPNIEQDFEEVIPFNICKRIVEQSENDTLSWDEVIKRIFEDVVEGCDYGHAQLIIEYLMVTDPEFIWPEKYAISTNAETALATVGSRESEFLARLEMAENYGWVESTARIDGIIADMEKRKQHYCDTGNFGFYFRTMNSYINNLQHDAETHKDFYTQRLTALKNSVGEEYPVFNEIERLIEENMYTVAQDYMDQVEKEGRRDLVESASLVDDNDALSKFIATYSNSVKDAREAETVKLSDIYNRHHRGEENNLVKTGRSMLDNWPRSLGGGNAMGDKLRSLFTYMGLPVKLIEMRDAQHFFMTFVQHESTADFPHPIGAYGSEMIKNGLHVFLLFGSKDEVTMNTAIRKLMTSAISGASVILADTQMSLAGKKKLAQTIKQENQNRNPYLIIDRVMLLHLANQPQTERWNVFLKCALPFHYYNPFTESNTAEICPEMFIGRRDELEQVTAAGGANIICGGRQLGKTALLHRARKLEDNRETGKWSIYIDIKQETVTSAAMRIYEKLQDEGFLPEDKNPIEWRELARKISNRIRKEKPEIKKFLLLLDEADNFFVDCQNVDFQPVDCLKQMQVDTENKFKFVLAGLHNVMRFHENVSDSNSTLPQLSTITIKPLPFKEASELLEKPLSYLGFKMHSENIPLISQILSSTNYYPGLIQFYASRLVRSICQNNYGDANDKPPYWLQEAQILTLLKDQEFLNNIKEKFMITLGIDQKEKGYYRTLANVLAYCYFQMPEGTSNGYTAEQLYKMCKDFYIYSITELKIGQVKVLLDELIGLNVLRKNIVDSENHYIFNRTSFRHMLGDEENVETALLDIMDKEHHEHDTL